VRISFFQVTEVFVVTYWNNVSLFVRVLRGIFGPKREEVAGGWRRLHSEELHNLYTSPNIIRVTKSRMIRWAGHITRMRDMRNAYILVLKLEKKGPLRRPRRRGKVILEWI
jgi:hypothetical protein